MDRLQVKLSILFPLFASILYNLHVLHLIDAVIIISFSSGLYVIVYVGSRCLCMIIIIRSIDLYIPPISYGIFL